jgi:hypothetical protein
MSDYIKIDNTCPEITLWEQYRKNDAAVNYFAWLKTYWQTKYFDYALNVLVPALASCNNNSEYLQFFARYMYGIIRPVDVTSALRYDEGLKYDESNVYDYRADAGVIALQYFRRIIAFVINWTEHDWNIPLLYKMVHDFTLADYTDIIIEQDDTRPDVFLITIPNGSAAALFKSLVQNYTAMWNLPLGVSLEITIA